MLNLSVKTMPCSDLTIPGLWYSLSHWLVLFLLVKKQIPKTKSRPSEVKNLQEARREQCGGGGWQTLTLPSLWQVLSMDRVWFLLGKWSLKMDCLIFLLIWKLKKLSPQNSKDREFCITYFNENLTTIFNGLILNLGKIQDIILQVKGTWRII